MAYRNDPFNALFDELVTRAFAPRRGDAERREEPAVAQWTPAIDAFIDGEKFVLEVMLAGVDPKTVELTATGNRLTVKGTRARHAPKDAKGFQYNEVVYGPFERTVELPEGTDAAHAEASFENGVLQIRLPALGSFVPKKIEIGTKPADLKAA